MGRGPHKHKGLPKGYTHKGLPEGCTHKGLPEGRAPVPDGQGHCKHKDLPEGRAAVAALLPHPAQLLLAAQHQPAVQQLAGEGLILLPPTATAAAPLLHATAAARSRAAHRLQAREGQGGIRY